MCSRKSIATTTKSLWDSLRKAKTTFSNDVTLLSCGYILGDVIGEGSYAIVHKAYSRELNKNVAVKIIMKKTAPERFLQHFLPREIDVIKRLRHPNILRYHQCIETNHRFFISMEYAANGSVLDLLLQRSQFTEPLGRKFFRELIGAVRYLHRYDVVHRDLKLENLMLNDEFEVKLGDFGFSRCMTHNVHANTGMRFLSTTYCGSHAYASPEILNFEPYDPKLSDVWACGVILYTMVFGCFPFDDRCFAKLLQQVIRPVVFWDTPALTNECKDLLRRIMAPLADRYGLDDIEMHEWMLANADGESDCAAFQQEIHKD